MTSTWRYDNDGLCDACGARADYYVENVGKKVETNEFCFEHAFLWSLFNPWAPTEGLSQLPYLSLIALFCTFYVFSYVGFGVRNRVINAKRQRVSKLLVTILFILGLTSFIFGIVTATDSSDSPLFRSTDQYGFLSEIPVNVATGWSTKSQEFTLEIDASCAFYSAYQVHTGDDPTIEKKDIKITVQAMEQNSPQLPFSIYVLDEYNFNLWSQGITTYTTYYETEVPISEVKTSITFGFSVPQDSMTFYFVIDDFNEEQSPTVLVTGRCSWAQLGNHYTSREIDLSKITVRNFTSTQDENEPKDFVLKGSATEMSGNVFNLYVLNETNYEKWKNYEPCEFYYQKTNIDSISFSIPLLKEEALSRIYVVTENPLVDTKETINLSARMEWSSVTTLRSSLLGFLIAFFGSIMIISSGPTVVLFLSRK
ncbi:MAG: hypothetical protein NWF06_11780 [Candidatus Bathyarchaeota archaeon]|nr:hypothetical protein [Candidatus Bathyarchaeum sp.]